MDAKLSDAGTLEGQAEYTEHANDEEVLVRNAFRMLPQPKWKDFVQQISYGTGFSGDVDAVTASSPEKTQEPFHFGYKYTRADYSDWANRRISAPIPVIGMPGIPDKDRTPENPIWLGAASELHFESHVELPKGYRPELPAAVRS